MKCQKCGKYEANTHITEIINGKKSEMFLCQSCAQLADDKPSYFTGFETDFNNLFSSLWPISKATSIPVPLKCPNCGTSLSDIQKSGRFGCSECYTVFFDYIKKPLKEIHGNTKHVGKVPKRVLNNLKETNLINQLKEELESAVKLQNFEEAAVLRDRIKDLENRLREV